MPQGVLTPWGILYRMMLLVSRHLLRRFSMKSKTIALSGLLIALGILIPTIFAPYAIRIEPYASYTIASHVPVMVAMFLSPTIAVSVAIGTAIGFLITTTPIIFARALTHVIFAFLGATCIQKNRKSLSNNKSLLVFNLALGIVHALAEVLVVTPFLVTSSTFELKTFLITVIGFVGIGGIIHSIIDFTLSTIVVKRLGKF